MIRNGDVVNSRRYAGMIPRYHTWPYVRRQTVGEHTWQVIRIYEELFGEPPAEVYRAIHRHDQPEIATGDVPFGAKLRNPELRNALLKAEGDWISDNATRIGYDEPSLTDVEQRRVKTADLVEMLEFSTDEMLAGNEFGAVVAANILPALAKIEDQEIQKAITGHVETARHYLRRFP